MTWLKLLLIGLVACSCNGGSPKPSAGSNSNWLRTCTDDAACTEQTTCHCGVCTRTCQRNDDCAELEDAHCVVQTEPPVRSVCRANASETALCLPTCEPGACAKDRACLLGSCVPDGLIASQLCSALPEPSDAERTRRDQVLDTFEQVRLQGGIDCGTGTLTPPGTALRFDARLSCAARALAADLNSTRAHSLIDSIGRSTNDRLTETGYSSTIWGEGYAFGATSANAAIQLMLNDSDACRALTGSARDVGVARVGDVDVVTVAAE
ncbi:MAG: CAP domain-containing protein [Myxococcota bacterium]